MGKKKRKTVDDYDYEDELDVQDLQGDGEVAKISLRDFIVEEKVSALCGVMCLVWRGNLVMSSLTIYGLGRYSRRPYVGLAIR